jgi:putative Ca2+/H+ antiporter (TMEM165/GDT1 family)
MRIVNRLYAFVGWAIVALGGLHMLTTIRLSASTPAFRVWFFGAGIAMALTGALNLLHRAYGSSAAGVRIVCRSANVLLTLFAGAAGALTGAGMAEYILIVSLVGGVLILSFVPSAIHGPHESEGS